MLTVGSFPEMTILGLSSLSDKSPKVEKKTSERKNLEQCEASALASEDLLAHTVIVYIIHIYTKEKHNWSTLIDKYFLILLKNW